MIQKSCVVKSNKTLFTTFKLSGHQRPGRPLHQHEKDERKALIAYGRACLPCRLKGIKVHKSSDMISLVPDVID